MHDLGLNLITIFTFFYAIFWASALESNAKYRPFDPIGFFNSSTEAIKIRRRFLIAFIFIDLIPVCYFALIFWLFSRFVDIQNITWWSLILTGITSLSVFGFTRLFPALVTYHKWAHYYYSKAEIDKIEISHHKNTFIAYFVSSLFYLFSPIVIVFLMYIIQRMPR